MRFCVSSGSAGQRCPAIRASAWARVGMAGCAPAFVVDSAPTALASRMASSIDCPSARPTARPALKESPAAVVSTAFTLKPGSIVAEDSVTSSTPAAPRLFSTIRAPRAISVRAAASACSTVSAGKPVRMASSVSLGVTMSHSAKASSGSGRAGAGKMGWNEIQDAVDWSEDGIAGRIGAAEMVTLTEESRDRIREMTESGQLPDIPVKPGDSVKEWTDRARLLNDPEEYAGGRMFALEGAAFRDVYVLSDKVSSRWDESRVQGIRADRGCFWGLCIGETAAEEWHMLLGEPDATATLDAEAAEAERTVPGTCDYYQYGNYRLQLHCGEDGILASVTLAE